MQLLATSGELVILSENEKPGKKIKDCFEKLNRVTFAHLIKV